jgi:hypothetical protein
VNSLRHKTQEVLRSIRGGSASLFEWTLVIFAFLLLLVGSYVYFAMINPSGVRFVHNAQAAFSDSLQALMSPAKTPTQNTNSITNSDSGTSAPQLTISQAPTQPAETSTVNQYVSNTISDAQVRSIISDYIKAGNYVTVGEDGGYFYITADNATGTTTNNTYNTYNTSTSIGDSTLSVPFTVSNGGTGASSVAGALSNLGLASGGSNDIWLHRTGGTLSGAVTLDTTDTGNIFKLVPRGDTGYLNGSGGAFFIDNSNNTGSGIGIYSTAGVEAQGNMINVTTTNSAFNQAAFYMSYHGISNAVEITNYNQDTSANALAVTGNNALDSAVGIIGHENGRGTIKISHYKNDGFSDANASGLSIDLRNSSGGEQTAAQGIYVDSTETSGTTGNLLRLRNQTIDRFVVNSLGSVQIGSSGTDTTITKLGNNSGDQFFVGTNGAFRVQRSAANSEAFRVQVNGDTQGRWLGTSDGQLKWGPGGSTTQDTVLKRIGVGQLSLEGGININNLNGTVDTLIKGQTDSAMFYADVSADSIGIGTSTPSSKLHVTGDIRVTGAYVDSSGDLGTSGQVLSSTGTGTNWIDAAAGSSFVNNGNSFTANAVLGTNDSFPLIFRTNTTEALRIDTSQNIGIGTSTIPARLTVQGAALDGTQADQSIGISSMAVSLTKNDTNTRTYFGLQIKPTINTGASNASTTLNVLNVDTTNTGTTGVTRNLLRLADGGTTRLLVQSGGNFQATATTTSGTAFNYLADSITSGIGYSLSVNALTNGSGFSLASSGTGANMTGNLANLSFTGNNASNTGNLLRVSNAGASNALTVAMFSNAGTGLSFRVNDDGTDTDSTAFVVDANGSVGIGSTAPSQMLDVEGLIQTDLGTSQSSTALCHSGTQGAGTNNDVNIVDCTGTPTADYMEMYSVDNDATLGDIVMPGSTFITTTTGQRITKLTKSSSPYAKGVVGILSNKDEAGDFNSIGYSIKDADNPQPIALNGRVRVKISQSSPAIEAGDYITTSSERGKGMKATHAGFMVAKALESWQPGQQYVMAFVANDYADPNDSLAKLRIDENGQITSPKIVADQISIGQDHMDLNAVLDQQSSVLSAFQIQTNNRLDKMEHDIATMSAALAQIPTSNITEVASIKTELSSLEQRTSSLESQVASLSARLNDSVLGISTASGSAQLATDSASFENLIVSGKTTLNNVGLTGSLSAGLLSINGLDASGSASINTLSGSLQLQSTGSGNVDIMNGKVVVEPSGNLVVKEGTIKGNDSTRGFNITVPENASSLEIHFIKPKINTDYAVSVLPTWITQTAIESKTVDGFKIKFSTNAPANAKVDWIIAE